MAIRGPDPLNGVARQNGDAGGGKFQPALAHLNLESGGVGAEEWEERQGAECEGDFSLRFHNNAYGKSKISYRYWEEDFLLERLVCSGNRSQSRSLDPPVWEKKVSGGPRPPAEKHRLKDDPANCERKEENCGSGRGQMEMPHNHFGARHGGEKDQRPVKQGEQEHCAENSAEDEGNPGWLGRGVDKCSQESSGDMATDKEAGNGNGDLLENKREHSPHQPEHQTDRKSEPGRGILDEVGSELEADPKADRSDEEPKEAAPKKEHERADDDAGKRQRRIEHGYFFRTIIWSRLALNGEPAFQAG